MDITELGEIIENKASRKNSAPTMSFGQRQTERLLEHWERKS